MPPDIRILHDGGWIHPGGGARVAVELANALDAPITVGHTECPDWWADRPPDVDIAFNDQLHDDLLARLIDRPALRPVAEMRLGKCFKSLDISEELVVSSGTVAKWWIPRHDQTHVHYCHTPPPRLYSEPKPSTVGWLQQYVARQIDRDFADYVDRYLANSPFTARRIAKHYRRDAEIVPPPVDVSRFNWQPASPDPYAVHIGRLVPMKRVRTIAEAAQDVDVRLVFVGDGPLRGDIEGYDDVTVYPDLSDWAVAQTVGRGIGGIAFAELEHCGITPKEFQAAGKPVVVPREPNLENHVVDGETGVIVEATVEGARSGLQQLVDGHKTGVWGRTRIEAAAADWSTDHFHARAREQILDWVSGDDRPSQRRDTDLTPDPVQNPNNSNPHPRGTHE